MERVSWNVPPGISYEVLRRWLELLEPGELTEIWRELREHPAHVVDVPGTTIESLLSRDRRRRIAGSDT